MNTNFFVRKDANGKYRWIGSHTNSFEDLDDDILTAESHLEFAKAIDSGEYPLPPLYLAHEELWKIGKTDLIVVDEIGPGTVFVITTGTFDEGMDKVAEVLSGVPVAMSHGLYVLQSGEFKGKRAIERYQTIEISALPEGVALPANPRTYYVVEDQMGIKDSVKRGKLAGLLGIDTVEEIESANKDIATKAKDDGIVFKEAEATGEVTEAAEVAEEVAAEVEETAEVAEVTEEVTEPAPAYVTEEAFEDFASLVGEMLKEFRKAITEDVAKSIGDLSASVTAANERLNEAGNEIKALKKHRDTPLAARPGYESLMKAMIEDSNDTKAGDEAVPAEEEKARKTPASANGALGLVYALLEES
jgi:hypothetical protein